MKSNDEIIELFESEIIEHLGDIYTAAPDIKKCDLSVLIGNKELLGRTEYEVLEQAKQISDYLKKIKGRYPGEKTIRICNLHMDIAEDENDNNIEKVVYFMGVYSLESLKV